MVLIVVVLEADFGDDFVVVETLYSTIGNQQGWPTPDEVWEWVIYRSAPCPDLAVGVVLLVPAVAVSVISVSDSMVLVARTCGKAHSIRSVDAMHLSYHQLLEACSGIISGDDRTDVFIKLINTLLPDCH